jgi:transcriptional regulator with XRE-family HTH domain
MRRPNEEQKRAAADASGFGGWLKRRREFRGLTQKQLGERAGVSQSYIARLERGTHEASRDVVEAIAAALGVSQKEALRAAGLLPLLQVETEYFDDPDTIAVLESYRGLTPAGKELVKSAIKSVEEIAAEVVREHRQVPYQTGPGAKRR